jgi:hypothetical protein
MQTYRKMCGVLIAMALLATVFGCAGSQTQPKFSGFLDDYPTMTKGAGDIDMRYLNPAVDWKKYDKILMDEVVFFFKADADYKGIHPSEIKELGDAFNETYAKKLAGYLTDQPGPGVARMRLAVVDLKPSKPVTGTMTTVGPPGLAASLLKKAATGEYIGIGSASAEVEFVDSVTNERLAVAVDKYPGGKFDIGKLSPAKAAFDYWSDMLLKFVRDKF